MSPVILRSALNDLERGFDFYERKSSGLGHYFEDTIFSDIASLRLYAGGSQEGARVPSNAVEPISLCDLLRCHWK
jgi:hypothetical protein